MAHWLVKSEPDTWSWDAHVKKGVEPWTGVRNYQAANNLKAMKVGDQAFFYHSNEGKEIVGIVEVVRTAYPDPSDKTGRFVCVDFRAVKPVTKPVTLADVKAEPKLGHLALIRLSRLSVQPVDDAAWKLILKMSGTKP
ncbi:MAG: EVE domain-containing protein [Rhodospirillales bacterium]|nr:EVE domain-containing protein [Rhodospirillales bacterium]